MNASLDFVAFLDLPFFFLLLMSDALEADAVSWTGWLLSSGFWDGCDQSSNVSGFIQALDTLQLVERACWGPLDRSSRLSLVEARFVPRVTRRSDGAQQTVVQGPRETGVKQSPKRRKAALLVYKRRDGGLQRRCCQNTDEGMTQELGELMRRRSTRCYRDQKREPTWRKEVAAVQNEQSS